MLFREHRGGLQESMETVVYVENKKDLVEHIRKLLNVWNVEVTSEMVTISKYNDQGDARIGWGKLSVVTVAEFGVIGWINSYPEELF